MNNPDKIKYALYDCDKDSAKKLKMGTIVRNKDGKGDFVIADSKYDGDSRVLYVELNRVHYC